MATIKDLKRMCMACTNCLCCTFCDFCCDVDYPIENLPDNADEIVDKWVKEHPVKTYINDFMNKFPHLAELDYDFKPTIYSYSYFCRKQLYGGNFKCTSNCEPCWNEEMKK